MILNLTALLLVEATTRPCVVDPWSYRAKEKLQADQQMVQGLQESGDVPTIKRPVRVHFEGSGAAIAKLRREIGLRGWSVASVSIQPDANVLMDVEREQTTDARAVRQMSEEALRIEAAYNVCYIGWGTEVKAKSTR